MSLADAGPMETLLGANPHLWRHPDNYRDRAVVIDLAGCTHDDVEAAIEQTERANSNGRIDSGYHMWNYLCQVVTRRIAQRELLARASWAGFDGADPQPAIVDPDRGPDR